MEKLLVAVADNKRLKHNPNFVVRPSLFQPFFKSDLPSLYFQNLLHAIFALRTFEKNNIASKHN